MGLAETLGCSNQSVTRALLCLRAWQSHVLCPGGRLALPVSPLAAGLQLAMAYTTSPGTAKLVHRGAMAVTQVCKMEQGCLDSREQIPCRAEPEVPWLS
ncbi:hypothetical protein DV515_00007078 [Chloebia gouldiae]|uniref:Uncharacterized protein n=1 Tax=Chloebia gouldiae TaxID=44316 RepID=A0A3L8SJ69_CHLGU|nr:hypothetical protein DV515_00007078 [Chloebia gouldiae]